MKPYCLVGLLLLLALPATDSRASDDNYSHQRENSAIPTVRVYKNPSCGCCNDWIKHLEQNGFEVTAINFSNMSALKRQLGVPDKLQSCHTAQVGGYIIEGHVPAADIRHLIETKPGYLGLSVPNMPVGSPGMEIGSRKDPFQVIGFDKDGNTKTVSKYHNH